jgi:hypothetical protein
VFDPVLHPRHWAQLIHEFICRQRVRSGRGEEIRHGAVGVTKVLFSVGECSFDSGRDNAHPGFEFAAMQQHAIMMDGKFENLFVGG